MRSKSVKEVLRILDWADILCLVEQGKDQVGESIKSQRSLCRSTVTRQVQGQARESASRSESRSSSSMAVERGKLWWDWRPAPLWCC